MASLISRMARQSRPPEAGGGPHRIDEGDIDVTVIVPVRNCRPYLDTCLTSILVQRVAKEIVVVDDGSTDGSRELLDLYASYHRGVVKVVRHEHSGGAGGPRNTGLAHARGRYVFFCDADDHMGPEALERMLAMADGNGSDIVLGRIVGHGRRAPESMFHQNLDRADLGDSPVYNSLSCFKLFRREMLVKYGVRFDERLLVGEDIVFTTHAYCHADVISVLADYDCYHLVDRPDGSSVMQQPGSRDPVAWLRMIKGPIELMTKHVRPGPLRDHLLRRHFRLDALAQLGRPFLVAEEVERKQIAEEVAELCDEWMTEGVRKRLPSIDRQRLESLADIDRLVRLAQIEAASVDSRLTGLWWQEGSLAVAGTATLEGLEPPGDYEVALVLRLRRGGLHDVTVPVSGGPRGFTASVEVAGLASGVWDIYAAVTCEGVTRLGRLGADRDEKVVRPSARVHDDIVLMPYFTRTHGNLSIDVGGHVTSVPGRVRLRGTRWAFGHRLVVDGEVKVGEGEIGGGGLRHLVWRERTSGQEHLERVVAHPGNLFAARTAAGRLGPGTWDAYLEVRLGGPPARFRIEAEPEAVTRPRSWWRGPVRRTVRPYVTNGKGRLSATVRVMRPTAALRRFIS
ncbi:Glycosyl transferase family 2 [Sinosporangium album]|uniref:Glycosyl transferase family 2 n=1 Tax=Sinosporangium album TaxID=504805 RepID=A0A1G8J536_9ACTN|nr:glycosyltransferase [Sinosporangium album]SDI26143.1 Glycosyl transferase family 2 [Sinosporangium album]